MYPVNAGADAKELLTKELLSMYDWQEIKGTLSKKKAWFFEAAEKFVSKDNYDYFKLNYDPHNAQQYHEFYRLLDFYVLETIWQIHTKGFSEVPIPDDGIFRDYVIEVLLPELNSGLDTRSGIALHVGSDVKSVDEYLAQNLYPNFNESSAKAGNSEKIETPLEAESENDHPNSIISEVSEDLRALISDNPFANEPAWYVCSHEGVDVAADELIVTAKVDCSKH